MKRILIVILAFILCIGLTACYDPSSKLFEMFVSDENGSDATEEFTIIGEWCRISDGLKLVFKENGVCTIDGVEEKYGYDAELGIVSHYGTVTRNYNLINENGVYKLIIDEDNVFVPAANYADIHKEYTESTEDLTFTIITDSMYPTLKSGDRILCVKVDPSELVIGDVITYWTVIDGERVVDTKRIVNIYDGGGYFIFETKGDNESEPSPLTVHQSEIMGRFVKVVGNLIG